MPYPMTPRNNNSPEIEVGSETGIEQKYSPLQVSRKSNKFDWLASMKKITLNLWDIFKILVKWR